MAKGLLRLASVLVCLLVECVHATTGLGIPTSTGGQLSPERMRTCSSRTWIRRARRAARGPGASSHRWTTPTLDGWLTQGSIAGVPTTVKFFNQPGDSLGGRTRIATVLPTSLVADNGVGFTGLRLRFVRDEPCAHPVRRHQERSAGKQHLCRRIQRLHTGKQWYHRLAPERRRQRVRQHH